MHKKSFRVTHALRAVPLVFALLSPALATAADATPSPAGAQAYFISPQNGETVRNPVVVRFGLKGMGIAPAGVEAPNTGHHHLIIDAPQPEAGKPIPTDDKHVHFGAGQTETTVTLPPGKHELQMVVGDHLHVPHNPPVVSERITITVE